MRRRNAWFNPYQARRNNGGRRRLSGASMGNPGADLGFLVWVMTRQIIRVAFVPGASLASASPRFVCSRRQEALIKVQRGDSIATNPWSADCASIFEKVRASSRRCYGNRQLAFDQSLLTSAATAI